MGIKKPYIFLITKEQTQCYKQFPKQEKQKNMNNTKNTKNTSRTNLTNHGGRFVTLNIRNKQRSERVCAKIVKLTDSYVTFYDVNARSTRKVLRSSVA